MAIGWWIRTNNVSNWLLEAPLVEIPKTQSAMDQELRNIPYKPLLNHYEPTLDMIDPTS